MSPRSWDQINTSAMGARESVGKTADALRTSVATTALALAGTLNELVEPSSGRPLTSAQLCNLAITARNHARRLAALAVDAATLVAKAEHLGSTIDLTTAAQDALDAAAKEHRR